MEIEWIQGDFGYFACYKKDLVLKAIEPLVALGILEKDNYYGEDWPDFYLNGRLVVSVLSDKVLVYKDFINEIPWG